MSALSADKAVEDLLAKMRKAYSSAKSVKLGVTSLMASELGEQELTVELMYVKPNKVATRVLGIPQAGKEGIQWRSDGKTIQWDTLEGKKSAAWTVRQAEQVAFAVNLETLNFWDWKRQLSTATGGNMKKSTFRLLAKETFQNKDYMVLEETAKEQQVFVRYFIDPKTYFIKRTRVERLDTKDLIMDCKVTKFELNAKVDPKAFKIETGKKI